MSLEKFKAQYSAYNTSELLLILQNAADYQSTAVEAAQIELDSRNLSDAELSLAREELAAEIQIAYEKNAVEKKVEEIKEQAKDSPYFSKTPSAEKSLMWFVGLVGLGAIWGVISALYDMFTINYVDSSFYPIDFSFLISHIFTFTILWFLYKRKKWAWALLTGLFICLVALDIVNLYLWFPSENTDNGLIQVFLDPYWHYETAFETLLYIGCLWLFYSEDFRNLFDATKRDFWKAAGIGLGIVLLFTYYFSL